MQPLALTDAKYAAAPDEYSSPVPAITPVSGATCPMMISLAAWDGIANIARAEIARRGAATACPRRKRKRMDVSCEGGAHEARRVPVDAVRNGNAVPCSLPFSMLFSWACPRRR